MITTGDAVFLFDFWGINTSESDSLLFSVTIDPNGFWVRDGGKENQIVGIGNRRLFYGGEDVNGKISVKRLIPID